MLGIIMLSTQMSIVFILQMTVLKMSLDCAECLYVECRYTESHYAERRYAECYLLSYCIIMLSVFILIVVMLSATRGSKAGAY